jgi:hypothetical protein
MKGWQPCQKNILFMHVGVQLNQGHKRDKIFLGTSCSVFLNLSGNEISDKYLLAAF